MLCIESWYWEKKQFPSKPRDSKFRAVIYLLTMSTWPHTEILHVDQHFN